MKDKRNGYKLVFNSTYNPNFSNLKDIMSFLRLVLTRDLEHQQVSRFPLLVSEERKDLKDTLVRAKVPQVLKK